MVANFENIPINLEVIISKERILFNDVALPLCTHLVQSAQIVEWNQNGIINAV